MIIATYSQEDLMQKWFEKKIPEAKNILEQFALLNQIFDKFSIFENKKYSTIKNIILWWCLPKIQGGLDKNSLASLLDVDASLSLFNVSGWTITKFNNLKSRLTSNDLTKNKSAVTELITAKHFADRFGKNNVEIFPMLSNGKFSDIKIILGGKDIYFEVGNLSESLPEKKINTIFNSTAYYLGNKFSTPNYLQIEIDTAELYFDPKGQINVKQSILKIESEITRYAIQEIVGYNGLVNIDNVVDSFSILKNIEIGKSKFLNPFVKQMSMQFADDIKLMNDPIIKNWINKCNLEELGKSKIIRSVITYPYPSLLVEIHTVGFSPSKSASAEQNSFVNHIARHVKGQINAGQLQSNTPNIIAVQAYNWTIFGLGENILDFQPVLDRLKILFRDIKEKDLSGVTVFSRYIDHAMYVNNDYSSKSSKLKKEEVEKIGLRWAG